MGKLLFFIGLIVLVLFVIAGVYYLVTNVRFGDKKLVNTDEKTSISKDDI